VRAADGDARTALNGLELAVNSSPKEKDGTIPLTVEHLRSALQRTHFLYDKGGEEHYNIISALHKSLRGSDADAALYWMARMLESGEDPLYVARRLVRFASEDVGMADPNALQQAVSAYQACHFIGMPECNVILVQCAVYLAKAPKSNKLYLAYGKAASDVRELPNLPVPLHLRNAPAKLMKDLGYGKGYKYNPAFDEPVDQDYLPEQLKGRKYL
jgi:putative ATPase